jgi:hypothetical protein
MERKLTVAHGFLYRDFFFLIYQLLIIRFVFSILIILLNREIKISNTFEE